MHPAPSQNGPLPPPARRPAPAPGELCGLRVTVMGLGAFGGGLGAVQFLLQEGARVTVTDLRCRGELADSLRQFDVDRLAGLALGEHRDEDFRSADLIVVNPAVRPVGNRFLDIARAAGIPLTSEMNLFWERCRGRMIVVTGAVGKSTTATLIERSLSAAGVRCRLGGNIGGSLLPEVATIEPEEWVVLELSSFQLHHLDALQPQPEIAVVTSFFPNHLNWHGSLDKYRAAKQVALRWQTPNQFAVLPAGDADVGSWPTAARRLWYGGEEELSGGHIRAARAAGCAVGIDVGDLAKSLQRPHGRRQVAAALTVGACVRRLQAGDRAAGGLAAESSDLPPAVREAFRGFVSLPHRLEEVVEVQGRLFLNDSKATTPPAVLAALAALAPRPVWLIAGGTDQGLDLNPLAAAIAGSARGVALLGQTAGALSRMLPAAGPPHVEVADLNEAVRWIWERSVAGEAILLSPGCASQPLFLNYEHRGEEFVRLARSLAESQGGVGRGNENPGAGAENP